MAKRIIIIISISVLSVFLLVLGVIFNCRYRNINFEYVTSLDIDSDPTEIFDDETYWFTLYDGIENTLHIKATPILQEKYGIEPGVDFDYDIENYTYVITCGHKLNSLEYSPVRFGWHSISFPGGFNGTSYFEGRVYLEPEKSNRFYIYKIKRLNICPDYYFPENYVFFVDSQQTSFDK